MGYVDVQGVSYVLPDGRVFLAGGYKSAEVWSEESLARRRVLFGQV